MDRHEARRSALDLATILDQQERITRLEHEVAQLEKLLWQATEYVDPFEQTRMSIH